MLHVSPEPFHTGLRVILTVCRGADFPYVIPMLSQIVQAQPSLHLSVALFHLSLEDFCVVVVFFLPVFAIFFSYDYVALERSMGRLCV